MEGTPNPNWAMPSLLAFFPQPHVTKVFVQVTHVTRTEPAKNEQHRGILTSLYKTIH